MSKTRLNKLAMAAMFTALCCVSTMVMFPIPTGGYVHPGDAIVLVTGWLLGPVYGTFAAALGSALADLFLGYAVYAPGTFVIKALVALCAWLIHSGLRKYNRVLSGIVSGLIAEIIMVLGYFLYAAVVFGEGLSAFAATVPANSLQGAFGVAVGVPLLILLEKILSKINRG